MPLFNQSRLGEVEKCPRRYFFRFICNLATKEPSVRLWAGSAVHEALAAHYRGLPISEVLGVYDAYWAKFPATSVTGADAAASQVLWRPRVENYPKQYPQENFDVLLVPEQELVVPLDDQFSMIMRLDLIIRRKDNGSVWVMDHKTANRTGPSYWPKYFVDLQGSSYVFGAQHVLGEEVAGWIINGVKSTKEGWYERQAFSRTARQVESFKRQTLNRMKELNEKHLDAPATIDLDDPGVLIWLDKAFPQYTHECHGFGTCPFLALCQTGEAAKPVYAQREPDYVDAGAVA